MQHVSTDAVIKAVRATRDIYQANWRRLVANRPESAETEFDRAALMATLANDDELCMMLAGRINNEVER